MRQPRFSRISTSTWAGVVLCSILLFWGAIRLYHRWFGLSKEEREFRVAYTAQYTEQPKRQEALTQWMAQGIVKRLAKHGPYAELFVGAAYYKCDSETRERVTQTVYSLYFMEDKSFRELAVLDDATGSQIATYNTKNGFRE
jgi:hypothetical protein